MNIAIIIAAHGKVAGKLLETAEIILGSQENISYIDFSPGENIKELNNEFEEKTTSMNCSLGVLFLVDVWGGSPFNVASHLVTRYENYDIVSGVNIPMLLDVLMARNENITIEELASIALQSGQAGVKAWKKPQKSVQSIPNAHLAKSPNDGYMSIVLARIDDRLIHTQVLNHWITQLGVKRIIIVNDELANNIEHQMLIQKVAPLDLMVNVFSVNKMIQTYHNHEYSNEKVFVICTTPNDVLKLNNNHIPIKLINVANMTFKKDKKQVSDSIFVDEQDIIAFKALNKNGIEIECRKVVSDDRINIMNLLKNI